LIHAIITYDCIYRFAMSRSLSTVRTAPAAVDLAGYTHHNHLADAVHNHMDLVAAVVGHIRPAAAAAANVRIHPATALDSHTLVHHDTPADNLTVSHTHTYHPEEAADSAYAQSSGSRSHLLAIAVVGRRFVVVVGLRMYELAFLRSLTRGRERRLVSNQVHPRGGFVCICILRR